jgi:hypothetical protein
MGHDETVMEASALAANLSSDGQAQILLLLHAFGEAGNR